MPVVHTLIVRVYRCLPGRLGLRGQRWRWKALASNGPNNQIVVRS